MKKGQRDLERLKKASGVEVDRLFLASMQAHHQAAIKMSQQAKPSLKRDKVKAVRRQDRGQPEEGDRRAEGASAVGVEEQVEVKRSVGNSYARAAVATISRQDSAQRRHSSAHRLIRSSLSSICSQLRAQASHTAAHTPHVAP